MAITIKKVTRDKYIEVRQYEVLNEKGRRVATFHHDRSQGLAMHLMRAANAVEQAEAQNNKK